MFLIHLHAKPSLSARRTILVFRTFNLINESRPSRTSQAFVNSRGKLNQGGLRTEQGQANFKRRGNHVAAQGYCEFAESD